MAVMTEGYEVGHIPRTVSQTVSFFLRKDESIGFCEVTGGMVNHGAGFGLEIPCIFYGRMACIERLKILLRYQRTLLTTVKKCIFLFYVVAV